MLLRFATEGCTRAPREIQVSQPTMPPEPTRTSGALTVTVGIALSRLFGFLRQAVVAHVLGVGPVADAVVAAFRIGNVAQNLVGEGTISAALVPDYVKTRSEHGDASATELARGALGALILATTALSALGMLLAAPLTTVFAAGISGDARALAVRLTVLAFPMTALLVLSAWALAILSANKRFLVAYTAPIVWSLAQIVAIGLAAWVFSGSGDALAEWLMLGATVGAALQLLILMAPARRLIGRVSPLFSFSSPRLRETLRKVPSTLLGRGVMQLSGLIDTSLVTLVGAGALSSFQYAQTAYLLPMALLGTGEAAVLLPALSGQLSGERRPLRETMGPALLRVVALGSATAMVFIVFAPEVIAVLFQRGAFGEGTKLAVAPVLAMYGVGLLSNAVGRMMSTACYSAGDNTTVGRYAIVRVVVSTAGSLALMKVLGVPGVVLGAVLGGTVEAGLLLRRTHAHYGETGLGAVPWMKIALACGLAALVGVGARMLLGRVAPGLGATLPLLHGLVILAAAGVAVLGMFQVLGVLRVSRLLRRR